MAKDTGAGFNEYKYHNWKLCQLSLDLQLSTLSHSPLEIQIEVTNHCNISCVMCTRPFIVAHPKHLKPNIISKLYPLFPGAGRVIPFGGGEPLLNPHFKEIVEYAKHCQAQVTFNTNGLLLNEELSRSFVSLGVDMITFSMDGAKEETYQAIRKRSNYTKVMANLETLARLKHEQGSRLVIGIAFVPMVDNIREIPGLFAMAKKLGIERFFVESLISPDRNWDEAYKNFYHQHALSNLPRAELTGYMKEYDAQAQKLGLQIFPSDYFSSFSKGREVSSGSNTAAPDPIPTDQPKNLNSGVANTRRRPIACTYPWTNIYVNADGLVQTCCLSSRVFGDLKTQEFSEIWNGPEFQSFRSQIITHEYPVECRNCLANGRNREAIPNLTLSRAQLMAAWNGTTRELINRINGKLRTIIHK